MNDRLDIFPSFPMACVYHADCTDEIVVIMTLNILILLTPCYQYMLYIFFVVLWIYCLPFWNCWNIYLDEYIKKKNMVLSDIRRNKTSMTGQSVVIDSEHERKKRPSISCMTLTHSIGGWHFFSSNENPSQEYNDISIYKYIWTKKKKKQITEWRMASTEKWHQRNKKEKNNIYIRTQTKSCIGGMKYKKKFKQKWTDIK